VRKKPNAKKHRKTDLEYVALIINRAGGVAAVAAALEITERQVYFYIDGTTTLPYAVQYAIENLRK
jgi:hypothetical protein